MTLEHEIYCLLQRDPEEFTHALDTLRYLRKINPNAREYFTIAALGHDIERVVFPWQTMQGIHEEEFRKKHALRSVEIIVPLMRKYNYLEQEIRKVASLIRAHEWGGNSDENLLRDADSLANFEWCDRFYGKRPIEEIKYVAEKMLNRMSKEHTWHIASIQFKHQEVRNIIMSIANID